MAEIAPDTRLSGVRMFRPDEDIIEVVGPGPALVLVVLGCVAGCLLCMVHFFLS